MDHLRRKGIDGLALQYQHTFRVLVDDQITLLRLLVGEEVAMPAQDQQSFSSPDLEDAHMYLLDPSRADIGLTSFATACIANDCATWSSMWSSNNHANSYSV